MIETIKGESMYFSDSWSFLVELEALPDKAPGIVPVDLSEEDDRGDVEPARDIHTGELFCTLGVRDHDDHETRRIARVWEYRENEAFNEKFAMFRPVTLADFVRRMLDANREFDGFTEDDARNLRETYGV